MRVGILGSGLMGGKLGTIFARAGYEVVFSYARTNDKLKRLARDAQGNARAGTPGEAAKDADAILLAVHWSRIDNVLKQAGDLSGKVILTCCLPMDAGNTKLIIGTTTSGAETSGSMRAPGLCGRVRGAPGVRAGAGCVGGSVTCVKAIYHSSSPQQYNLHRWIGLF
jgi:3-hydroxyisobutyrate dehydrogenase-like beta-hydroxyacid dehydrogenase